MTRPALQTIPVAKASQSVTPPLYTALTSPRVSNCNQSPVPVGSIPILLHLYSPSDSLFHQYSSIFLHSH